jgi:DNA-binding Lrp family transcriptional regulator
MRLDDVDLRILGVLADDARTPNNLLASRVGIAPSTCLSRVRALRDAGVIRGYHADISPQALGLPLHAMIAVRLQASERTQIGAFTDRMRTKSGVRAVYFVAGSVDFLLDVVARDAAALRDFVVDELSARGEVASTETHLIFEHARGAAWLPRPGADRPPGPRPGT